MFRLKIPSVNSCAFSVTEILDGRWSSSLAAQKNIEIVHLEKFLKKDILHVYSEFCFHQSSWQIHKSSIELSNIHYLLRVLVVCALVCSHLVDCSPPGPSVHGILRQEYWRGSPCSTPGHLPDPRTEPMFYVSLALQAGSLPPEPLEKPVYYMPGIKCFAFVNQTSYNNLLRWGWCYDIYFT